MNKGTLYSIMLHDAKTVEQFANHYSWYAEKYNLKKAKDVDILSICHNGRCYVVFFYLK